MQNCISGDVNLGEHIISESLKFCAAIDKEKSSEINRFQRALVRVARLERAASTSQMWRPTNWATPGYSISVMIPRRTVKIKFFLSVVIPVVKAAFVPFSATGGKPAIARAARHSGLLSKPRMDRVYALPNQARYQLRYTRIFTFPPLYHVEEENQSFFCPRPFLWANSFLRRSQ